MTGVSACLNRGDLDPKSQQVFFFFSCVISIIDLAGLSDIRIFVAFLLCVFLF
jgi:hypothetical protein